MLGLEVRAHAGTPTRQLADAKQPGTLAKFLQPLCAPNPPPAGMCLTTVVSYISHSQVWAAQQPGGSVVLGGRSNRAKFGFKRELDEIIDGVPEVSPLFPSPRG